MSAVDRDVPSLDLVDGCGAGLALHRLAAGSPHRIALSAGERELQWQDLAREADDLARYLEADPHATEAVNLEAADGVRRLIGEWATLLTDRPLFDPDSARPAGRWATRTVRVAPPGPVHGDAGGGLALRDPQDGDRPAVVRESPTTPDAGWVWRHSDLLRLWSVLSPRPGSTALAAERGFARWASVHATLLGRGRVVVADGGWADRLAAVDEEGVDEVHLAAAELEEVLGVATAHSTVRQVTVWASGTVDLPLLDAVSRAFPAARVRRCIATPWTPVAIADLRALHEVGVRWLGEPVLGSDLVVVGDGGVRRLLVDALFAGSLIHATGPLVGHDDGAVDTGLLVESDAWSSAGAPHHGTAREVLLVASA